MTSARDCSVGTSASVAIRPELVAIGPAASDADELGTDLSLPGRVKNRIFLGEHTEYLVATPDFGDILVLSPKHIENIKGGYGLGENVVIGWKNEAALALPDT